jgi:hypothetical protein
VEYRGIRYTVRARIERNEWVVSIYPRGIEGTRKVVAGSRERAELLVRSMIDKWYERAPRSATKDKARHIGTNNAKLPQLLRNGETQ